MDYKNDIQEGHKEGILIAKGLCEIHFPTRNNKVIYLTANNLHEAIEQFCKTHFKDHTHIKPL